MRGKWLYCRRNYKNTPFFKSLIGILQEKYSCDYYGYVNGDILLSSTILSTLRNVSHFIQTKQLHPRVLITGRRTNGDVPLSSYISSRVHQNDQVIAKEAKHGILFREDALVGEGIDRDG